MSQYFSKAYAPVRTVALVCLTLVMIYGLAVRFLTAQIPDLKPQITSRLTNILGNETRIGTIEVGWHNFTPWLRLQDFEIVSAAGISAIQIDLIEFSFSPVQWVLSRSLSADVLRVTGGDLQLTQNSEGGLGLRGGRGGVDLNLQPLFEFVLETDDWYFGNIRLRLDSDLIWLAGRPVDWTLEAAAQRQILWTNLLVDIDNRANRKADKPPSQLRLQGRFRGDPQRLEGFSLDATVSANVFDLQDWRNPVQLASNSLDSVDAGPLVANIRLRPEYRLKTTFSAENLSATLVNQLGESSVFSTQVARLSLQSESSKQWQVQVDLEKSNNDGLPMPSLVAAVEIDRRSSSDHYWIHIRELNTQHLNHFLLFDQEVSAQIKHWVNEINPLATTKDMYVRMRHTPNEPVELALTAKIDDLKVRDFNAIPYMDGVQGHLLLSERGGLFEVDSGPFKMAFPSLLAPITQVHEARFDLLFSIAPDAFYIRCDDLYLSSEYSRVRGGFALSNPAEPSLRTATVQLSFTDIVSSRSLDLLPVTMKEDLKIWIRDAFKDGEVVQGGLLYHSHLSPSGTPIDLSSLSLLFDLEGVVFDYHPDWPRAEETQGRLMVTENHSRLFLSKARIFDIEFTQASVEIPLVDSLLQPVNILARSHSRLERIMEFTRQTPARDFVDPDVLEWQTSGDGRFQLELDLILDLSDTEQPRDEARLIADGQISDAQLNIVQSSMVFTEGSGHIRLDSELGVFSEGLDFRLFGGESSAKIRSDWSDETQSRVYVDSTGVIHSEPLAAWLDTPSLRLLSGEFSYSGQTRLLLVEGVPIEMQLTSDLTGLYSPLPEPFGKSPDEAWPSRVDLSVNAHDKTLMDFQLNGFVEGQLELIEDKLTRGVVRVYSEEAMSMPDEPVGVDIFGNIKTTDVGSWIDYVDALDEVYAEYSSDGSTEAPNLIHSIVVRAEHMTFGEFDIHDSLLTMYRKGELWDGRIIANEIGGTFQIPDDDNSPVTADLRWVRVNYEDELAEEASDDFDPLLDVDFADLVPTLFEVSLLEIDREDYGAWSFLLEPEENEVRLLNLGANIRGLLLGMKYPLTREAQPQGEIVWQRTPSGDRTRYVGDISGRDLGKVFSSWGYSEFLRTRQADMITDLEWPGSPAFFDWLSLQGKVEFDLLKGELTTEDKGVSNAIRFISLFDFSFWVRRLYFDFSDLEAKGIAFDSLQGKAEFNAGMVSVDEPARMQAPGADLAFKGEANVIDNRIDGELIATLPVSKNLPWLAAYLALSNPITGAITFLANRIFRRGIDRLSSGKYEVSGALDNPDIKFSQVFADFSVDTHDATDEEEKANSLKKTTAEERGQASAL